MKNDNKPSVDSIKQKVIPILKRHGAKKAGLFGSLVRNEAKPRSDIDILVDLDTNLSLIDIVRIKLELEKAIGRKVDLVQYAAIKPFLKDQILNEELKII